MMKLSAPTLVVLIAASASAQRQPPSNISEFQEYSLQADNLVDALLKISAHFQIPMGVEWVKSADTVKPVQIFQGYTAVKDIVDAVVFNYAGYECRMEDGVLHVFQQNLVSDARNPLNITIESFEVKNTVHMGKCRSLQHDSECRSDAGFERHCHEHWQFSERSDLQLYR